MVRDDGFDVVHGAAAQFENVSAKDFEEGIWLRKLLVDERKEVPTYFVSTFLLYGGLNGSYVVAGVSWCVSM